MLAEAQPQLGTVVAAAAGCLRQARIPRQAGPVRGVWAAEAAEAAEAASLAQRAATALR